MSSTPYSEPPKPDYAVPDYAWELAEFFPAQGEW